MNKKTVSKLEMFFSGLVSRMEENKDFFKDINIIYKSGTKNFKAHIFYEDGLMLNFQAITREVSTDDILLFLREESSTILASGVKADVQPLSGALAMELYGFEKKCEKRMFYKECEHIKVGRYVVYNNVLFRIEYVTQRNFGNMALLKSVGEEKQSNEGY